MIQQCFVLLLGEYLLLNQLTRTASAARNRCSRLGVCIHPEVLLSIPVVSRNGLAGELIRVVRLFRKPRMPRQSCKLFKAHAGSQPPHGETEVILRSGLFIATFFVRRYVR